MVSSHSVDFGRSPAARAADRLPEVPSLRPQRAMGSYVGLGTRIVPTYPVATMSAQKMLAHRPRRLQRLNRFRSSCKGRKPWDSRANALKTAACACSR